MELLRALIAGSPIGRTRDAAPGAPPDRPVQRLLAAGLLQRIDDETVLLPRFVAQLLRGEEPDRLQSPAVETTTATQSEADAAAAGAALDLLREVGLLLDELGVNPRPNCAAVGWACARSSGWQRRPASRTTAWVCCWRYWPRRS